MSQMFVRNNLTNTPRFSKTMRRDAGATWRYKIDVRVDNDGELEIYVSEHCVHQFTWKEVPFKKDELIAFAELLQEAAEYLDE